MLEEFDESGALTASYIYGDDLISQVREDKKKWITNYFHYDGQMSMRQLSNTSQAVTDTYTYDAFGVLTSQSGSTPNNYLYTGEQYDPNAGFYYLRARYYDQATGRFLTVDPWAGLERTPESFHKYTYCYNNPSNLIDPSGLMILDLMMSMSIDSLLRKNESGQKVLLGRRILVNLGCAVVEEIITEAITDAIYVFVDSVSGKPYYAGSTNDIQRRTPEHIYEHNKAVKNKLEDSVKNKIKKLDDHIKIFPLGDSGGKKLTSEQRRVVEQMVMDELELERETLDKNRRRAVAKNKMKKLKKAGKIFDICP